MALQYKNILVGVDGSNEAEWAFQKAIEIAKRNDSKLSLLHVIDTRSFAAVESYDRKIADRAERFAHDLLKKYEDQALQSGVKHVNTLLEYGSPKVIIPKDAANKVNADLIICGATGLNAVERFLIGSVSDHIVRSAPCDVLIVRTKEDE